MRLITVGESYVPGQSFTLWPINDPHLGSANCDTGLLDETIGKIRADKNARWVGIGDMCEAISPKDKRWSGEGIDEKIVNLASQDRIGDVYVEKLADRFAPIADKLWAYGDGNHEQKFNEMYYTNLSVRVLEKLGRSDCYAGWAAMTRIVFESGEKRRPIRIFQQHGYQAGRKDGAKVNGLDDLMGYVEGCRIYLVGHSHSVLIKSKTRLGTNPSFTIPKAYDSYGAHCGSFLRTYQLGQAGYSERAGYPPTSLKRIRFILRPGESGVEIEAVQ